jgi:hypothetical protein
MGDSFDEIFRNLGGIKGPQPGTYIVTGPDFQGSTPGEMTRITTRTKIGVMAVRIFVNGETDLPEVTGEADVLPPERSNMPAHFGHWMRVPYIT